MGLSFVNPSGFKFFIISNAIALLILSMVKSIADIIPDIDVLRFSVINGIGMLLFIGSLYIGRLTTDSKKIWFYNGFTAAGLILIIYSSSMEIQGAMGNGAMHEFAIPVVHILEVFIVLCVHNKMIKYYDEREEVEVYRAQPLSFYCGRVDLTLHRIPFRDQKPWSYSLA